MLLTPRQRAALAAAPFTRRQLARLFGKADGARCAAYALERKGLVRRDTKIAADGPSGRRAVVWTLTAAGRYVRSQLDQLAA